jgi:hypothetical protein
MRSARREQAEGILERGLEEASRTAGAGSVRLKKKKAALATGQLRQLRRAKNEWSCRGSPCSGPGIQGTVGGRSSGREQLVCWWPGRNHGYHAVRGFKKIGNWCRLAKSKLGRDSDSIECRRLMTKASWGEQSRPGHGASETKRPKLHSRGGDGAGPIYGRQQG